MLGVALANVDHVRDATKMVAGVAPGGIGGLGTAPRTHMTCFPAAYLIFQSPRHCCERRSLYVL
jgi:hypothetical protein